MELLKLNEKFTEFLDLASVSEMDNIFSHVELYEVQYSVLSRPLLFLALSSYHDKASDISEGPLKDELYNFLESK